MRWFRFAVLVIAAAVLQYGILSYFAVTPLNIKPDLLLVLLVFFAVYCNVGDAIIASFSIGFAADLIASAMGAYTISFGLFGTLLVYLHRVVAIRKPTHQSLAIFVMGILSGILAFLLTKIIRQPTAPGILTVIFATSLYSAVLGPFFFLPTAWLMRIKTHRFSKH